MTRTNPSLRNTSLLNQDRIKKIDPFFVLWETKCHMDSQTFVSISTMNSVHSISKLYLRPWPNWPASQQKQRLCEHIELREVHSFHVTENFCSPAKLEGVASSHLQSAIINSLQPKIKNKQTNSNKAKSKNSQNNNYEIAIPIDTNITLALYKLQVVIYSPCTNVSVLAKANVFLITFDVINDQIWRHKL